MVTNKHIVTVNLYKNIFQYFLRAVFYLIVYLEYDVILMKFEILTGELVHGCTSIKGPVHKLESSKSLIQLRVRVSTPSDPQLTEHSDQSDH